MTNINGRNWSLTGALVVVLAILVWATPLDAHGVSGKDAVFLQGLKGRAIVPLMYLGAKHMVTGYDHLLFLVGVIFFLYRLKDVAVYVSLFTIGHSITLLAGVLGGIRANPYLIDAIIGFSVVYKAFENMDGFRRFFGFQPEHARSRCSSSACSTASGLATKLQDFALSRDGLVANIVSFNVGVEIGQVLALTAILIGLTWWRTRSGFMRHAFAFNGVVMACGLLLVGYQTVRLLSGHAMTTARSAEHDSDVKQRIGVAAGAALLVAGVLLVTVVLPAEFGVDPLGTGQRLGLLPLGLIGREVDALSRAAASREGAQNAVVAGEERPFHEETVAFTIAPHDFVEYKYRLDKGQALLYSWSATAAVTYELHAEPDGAPKGYAESYEKQPNTREASGTLTAPFLRNPRMVLGEHRQPTGDGHAQERRVLHDVP